MKVGSRISLGTKPMLPYVCILTLATLSTHPSVEMDLSLKIEVRDQTIWKSTTEAIASLLYSNEIQIWEIFSKIRQMVLAIV